MAQPKIEVAISAKADQLSTSLAKVRKEIAGLPDLASKASRKTGELDPFGTGKGRSMFGLDRVEKQIGRLYGSARVGAGGLTCGIGLAARSIPGLGLVAGAASVAGIGEMITHLAGAGVELTNTARLAGTTASGLNSMRGAARLMGLSAETADGAMLGLNHTIKDAVFGRNADAANLFAKTGIDIGSIGRGAKSAEAVLPQMVDTLTRLAKNNPLAAERLAGVWGIPSAALPMLIRGSDALQANRREVEQIYGSFDKYQESSERFTFATGRLSLASEKLGQTVMTSLEPHLSPLLLSLSTWVEKHDKDVGETFDHIAHAISQVDFKKIGEGLEEAGGYAKGAVKWFDDLASSWQKLNEYGKPVSDFLNRMTGAGNGGQSGVYEYFRHIGARNSAVGVENAGQGAYEYASPRERAGAGQPAILGPGMGPISTKDQDDRARRGRDILIDKGWSPKQAAGIMAGLIKESGLREGAVGDGQTAYGIAQWHPDRRAKIEQGMGKSVQAMSFEEQIKAVDWELRNNEKSAGEALRRTTTAADAGDIVSRRYERPRDVEGEASGRARSAEALSRRWDTEDAPARMQQIAADRLKDVPQSSLVTVEINHSNVPAGVTMTPSVKGPGAELGGIRVKKAMPNAGAMPPWGDLN